MRIIGIVLVFLALPVFAADWHVRGDSHAIGAVKKLVKENPAEQLRIVRESGICVRILNADRRKSHGFFMWKDAEMPTGKLTEITLQPALMGKTLCQGEQPLAEKCTTIAIAADAPRVTLLHEFLHTKQIAKDPSWCKLSKELWHRTASLAEQRELKDREWDVLTTLWKNRVALKLDAQDRVAVAGELSELAPQRKYDASAAKFMATTQVSKELKKAIAEFTKH